MVVVLMEVMAVKAVKAVVMMVYGVVVSWHQSGRRYLHSMRQRRERLAEVRRKLRVPWARDLRGEGGSDEGRWCRGVVVPWRQSGGSGSGSCGEGGGGGGGGGVSFGRQKILYQCRGQRPL